jgi:uncharacterized membrane protein YeaQ/YmgE (transglycosylase-associated protein family)
LGRTTTESFVRPKGAHSLDKVMSERAHLRRDDFGRRHFVPTLDARRKIMSAETVLIWLAVGLVAGWLASAVVGGGLGVVGDIVIGIVGSFLGGLIFRTAHIGTPFRGLVATIFVAFVGAVALLLILRLIRRGTPRRL